VSGNTIHHNSLEYASSGVFLATAGIRVGTTTTPASIYDWTIEDNTLYNHGDSFSAGQYSGAGIWTFNSGTGMVVRYNKSYDNHHHGIELEGGIGITWVGQSVYYNILYGNYAGIAIQTNCDDNLIYNNTSYANQLGINIDGQGSGVSDNLIKNNILFENTTRELRVLNGGENDGVEGSGNVYQYNNFGEASANFIEWGDGEYISTYAVFNDSLGYTSNNAEGDPLFTNAAGGDFTLLPTSPAIDAGMDVSLVLDYAGNVVPFDAHGTRTPNFDIGAYEYQLLVPGTWGYEIRFPRFLDFPKFKRH